jgi:hypothetical protein
MTPPPLSHAFPAIYGQLVEPHPLVADGRPNAWALCGAGCGTFLHQSSGQRFLASGLPGPALCPVLMAAVASTTSVPVGALTDPDLVDMIRRMTTGAPAAPETSTASVQLATLQSALLHRAAAFLGATMVALADADLPSAAVRLRPEPAAPVAVPARTALAIAFAEVVSALGVASITRMAHEVAKDKAIRDSLWAPLADAAAADLALRFPERVLHVPADRDAAVAPLRAPPVLTLHGPAASVLGLAPRAGLAAALAECPTSRLAWSRRSGPRSSKR